MKYRILFLFIFLCYHQAIADEFIQNSSIDFFELELGALSPFPETKEEQTPSSMPMNTFVVSLPATSKVAHTSKFRMNVDKESNLVSWIGFQATFNTKGACHSNSKEFMAIAKETYRLPSDSDAQGFIDATSGDVEVSIFCGWDPADSEEESLNVSIRSQKLTKLHQKKLDEIIRNQ